MIILFYQKIYRTRFSIYDQLRMDELSQILPADVEITFDRSKFSIADRTAMLSIQTLPAGQCYLFPINIAI